MAIDGYYQRKNTLSASELSQLREHNSQEILSRIAEESLQIIPLARELLKNRDIAAYLGSYRNNFV